ncbi:Chorismate synthase [Symbiodinium microadriaticum]|uniref:chorismate synthase n=1 Tax=Symbiodinium microadriaticum TaxID=2951 RepID=A0A1Q9EM05_SYMMI|nr:Chorismate synthase [Symbiodinium microadriaticum]
MTALPPFGDAVPLGDPAWYQGLNTPFYKPTHAAWRKYVRDYCEEVLEPVLDDWEQCAVKGNLDKCHEYMHQTYAEGGKRGILACAVGKPWPKDYTNCTAPEDYDNFHELIVIDETTRISGGISWAVLGGLSIGLPPVVNFGVPGDRDLQARCIRECLSGEKVICLCITEASAGSDVAGLACRAEDAGDHFLVNGEKKWITNGIYADYFTVIVQTGPPGSRQKGLSMLLMERSMPGIETRKMDCTGMWSSGTTFITFDNVKVPKTNIIGKLNGGFMQAMYNFNHERWMFLVQANRGARVCVEESLKFARKRRTFGKFLIEHQVIQHKIGEMGRQCEALQAWIDYLTKEEQNKKLGGYIALLKVSATKTVEYCAREALQVFGGAGYTRTGQGEKVERVYREVKAWAIPGGSEEIMLNLAAGSLRFVKRPTPDPRDATIKKLKEELEGLKKSGCPGAASVKPSGSVCEENGMTLGTPIAMMVRNQDQRKFDYANTSAAPRPGHADYTYQVKYGTRASSGGGRASARETIGRVAAGAVAEKWLKLEHDTRISCWVSSIMDIDLPKDVARALESDPPTREEIDTVGTLAEDEEKGYFIDLHGRKYSRKSGEPLAAGEAPEGKNYEEGKKLHTRCPHPPTAARMAARIQQLRAEEDSTGGVVTTVVTGMPIGIGEPCFDKLEAELAKAMMSLPATKAFEIGDGFETCRARGSQNNDLFTKGANGLLKCKTNHAGGTLGGITSGVTKMHEVFGASCDDTCTFDGEPHTLSVKGRHDPCVLPRAPPLVEGMTAMVLIDAVLRQRARMATPCKTLGELGQCHGSRELKMEFIPAQAAEQREGKKKQSGTSSKSRASVLTDLFSSTTSAIRDRPGALGETAVVADFTNLAKICTKSYMAMLTAMEELKFQFDTLRSTTTVGEADTSLLIYKSQTSFGNILLMGAAVLGLEIGDPPSGDTADSDQLVRHRVSNPAPIPWDIDPNDLQGMMDMYDNDKSEEGKRLREKAQEFIKDNSAPEALSSDLELASYFKQLRELVEKTKSAIEASPPLNEIEDVDMRLVQFAASFIVLVSHVGRKVTSTTSAHLQRRYSAALALLSGSLSMAGDVAVIAKGLPFLFQDLEKTSPALGLYARAKRSPTLRYLSQKILVAAAKATETKPLADEHLGYRQYSGLLPVAVAWSYSATRLPAVMLLPGMEAEARSLFGQIDYVVHSRDVLKYAKYERVAMPSQLKGRRELAVLFELGLTLAKMDGKLINYAASTSLNSRQLAAFETAKAAALQEKMVQGPLISDAEYYARYLMEQGIQIDSQVLAQQGEVLRDAMMRAIRVDEAEDHAPKISGV